MLDAFSAPDTKHIPLEGYRRAHADAIVEVVLFERELIKSALRLYSARPDKPWSLTDCISFVVMERRGLREALTADGDLQQANLNPLLFGDPPL
ncbi:MAG: type II toxin-antitoxin system VapC family toxin [Acidobacteria bacterium]|nr:type II toxin-antitoxin system VapC family toxin [Acidobacteriota bacterium]